MNFQMSIPLKLNNEVNINKDKMKIIIVKKIFINFFKIKINFSEN